MKQKWRVQSSDDGEFDELAVTYGNECLIHAEMMDSKSIYVSVGPISIWAYVDKDGVVRISDTETRYEDPVHV